ncbi:hypothetical protein R3P38DRAFT_3612678 [Favolaschia claudopus]|uniref:Uncharacterized protein n=1 Tax=Favolaschia claudopus TaxID=2862362 RepID=A0AAW0A674_9AGAR
MVLPSNALLAAQSPKRIFVLFAPPSTFPRASVLPSGSPPPLPSGPGSLPPRQILDFRETALDLPENMDYPPVSAHSFRCGNGFGEILDRNGPIWCILRPPGPGLHRRSLARFLGSTSDSLAFLQSSTRSPDPPGAPLAEIWRKWPTGAGALGTTPSDTQELFRADPPPSCSSRLAYIGPGPAQWPSLVDGQRFAGSLRGLRGNRVVFRSLPHDVG